MKKAWWIVVVVVVVVILAYGFSTYNSLVTKRESVDNQWAQVGTQYQRRFDLIPNLVASVKGAMAQEQTVFDNIAEARTRYAGAQTVNEKAEAATQVESALGRLLVVMENYPQLASIETVQTLMVQLEGTENRVSVERKRFNDEVRDYNVMTKRFPTSVVAGLFGFDERAYFEAAAGTENAPQVNF
jgi:LemA protein